ncbi:unnamed protein product, partial [Mesorhabditis belari]|uniref:Uncharacterized protein n=1 Tax=Mesorhabditis belari TaxID=2138241 RepID=A0AAF3J233_9BILA
MLLKERKFEKITLFVTDYLRPLRWFNENSLRTRVVHLDFLESTLDLIEDYFPVGLRCSTLEREFFKEKIGKEIDLTTFELFSAQFNETFTCYVAQSQRGSTAKTEFPDAGGSELMFFGQRSNHSNSAKKKIDVFIVENQ